MIIIASYSNVSVTYTADGTQTVFSFPFDYLRKAFVYVEVNEETILTQGTDYSVSGQTVVFTTAPTSGNLLRIYRETDTTRLVSWADASVLKASDMTIQQVQELHILEEQEYWTKENTIVRNGHEWNARHFPIKNTGDPVDPKDATTKEYVDDELDTAIENLQLLADIVVDSEELQHITDQFNAIDENAEIAANAAETAVDSATSANASKNSAGASATSATNTANALINFLETKETLTAPVIDPTLTIRGASADAKVVGLKVNTLPSQDLYIGTIITEGKYLDVDGNEQINANWAITDYLPVYLDRRCTYSGVGTSSTGAYKVFYDENYVFLASRQTDQSGDLQNIPNNSKYVRFSIVKANKDVFSYTAISVQPYNDKTTLPAEKLHGINVTSYIDDVSNRASGYWSRTAKEIVSSSEWKHLPLFSVKKGDIITIHDAIGVVFSLYDATDGSVIENVYFGSNHYDNYIHQVPNDGLLGVNVANIYSSTFALYINGAKVVSNADIEWLNINIPTPTSESIWLLKTYISHGDSITWQDGKAYQQGQHIGEIARGYQTIFSEAVGLASYNNQGKSGWSMAVVNGNGIVNTIRAIADYGVYNLCTIACGTNDFKLNVPIGTLGQIGDITFDDTTFYGAFRKAVEYILTSSPTIRLVLMTPLQRDNAGYDVNYVNSAGHKLIDYVNAVKDIGEMYGLPVCDMYGNSGFTKKTLSTYTMDGLHPNDVGYQRMGGYLTQFLNGVGN